ncbi:MAG: small ribosomal subunit Rsm22 family protein [Treponema sp.]|jgi:hypothetical protein|nr:small ribosomal subunit Rsm22 family protein [Treponema sp.]
MPFSFPPETSRILESIPSIIEKTFPVPGRFRNALPSQVAELSRLLTGARGARTLNYLNQPRYLCAYLHYFFPWNLYRLCYLLTGLELKLNAGDTIVDLGCGPLTFTCALWISRPELRKKALAFRCVDQCSSVLDAGKKLFSALCQTANSPWKIITIREKINTKTGRINIKGERAALVSAVNLWNEMYENISHNDTDALWQEALNCARVMSAFAADKTQVLTVEPGVPRSGHFIAMLRSAFISNKRFPVSPCTHYGDCPLLTEYRKHSGSHVKKRWCHFAFDAFDSPKELKHLSASAGIPKERLVLSYLLAGTVIKTVKNTSQPGQSADEKLRIISGTFSLPNNKFGRYACCEHGLVLLSGEKKQIEDAASGTIVNGRFPAKMPRDAKSRALIIELKGIK